MTLEQRIEAAQNSLAAATTEEQKQLLSLGIEKLKEMLSQQKKSESHPVEKIEQLQQRTEAEEIQLAMQQRDEMLKTKKWQGIREKLPAMARAYDETVKTVKAPAFVTPDELINIELEDSKGNKQVKTFSKAQVRALARKYFSNVHESWLGKDRKMGVGFKNLLAYVVAWKEFDGTLPAIRDILPDYDRYNKGCESKEASDTFKVAQELYNKIIEILQQ